MKVGTPTHERLVVSTYEYSATATCKTTPLGTTFNDPLKPDPNRK